MGSNGCGRNGKSSIFFFLKSLQYVAFRLPDLSLPVQHPRRAFMRRAVEFEIRLSYHDRIMKTLPESMQSPDAFIISEQAPGPAYEYDDISQFSLSLLLHSKILKYG